MPPDLPLHHLETIGSTSEALKRLADEGAPEQALLATRQTGGRGRLGRIWQSPPGNLYFSVLLRPTQPITPGHWSLLAAIAAADAIAALAGPIPLHLKWPNDLMLGPAKLGGILLDAGANQATPWLVIGFGINLASAPQNLGRPAAALATISPKQPNAPTRPPSLLQGGAGGGSLPMPHPNATPQTLAPLILHHLHHWRRRYQQEGFDPIRTHWQHLARLPHGAPMVIAQGPNRTHGAYAGIAHDGALILRQPGGALIQIRSGEPE